MFGSGVSGRDRKDGGGEFGIVFEDAASRADKVLDPELVAMLPWTSRSSSSWAT